MNANTKPAWAMNDIALDPYAAAQDVRWTDGRRTATARLTGKGASVRTALPCGLPVGLAMPRAAFEGVAARAFENEDGSFTVTLELLHADPALCVPLLVSNDPEAAARDWRSWSRNMGLPMVMATEEGTVRVDDAPAMAYGRPRRRTGARHRPNFLRRRRTGMVGASVKLEAREIIARN